MKNYYQTLGVDKGATPEEIKRAYRKLASLYHPDKEGGSKTKFQEVEEAYRTLSDDQKRAQYDNPGQGFGGFNPGAPFDFDSIFSMFGTRFQHPGQQRRQQARMSLWITLRDVAEGGNKTITVGTQHGTHAVEIEIPLAIRDGDNVQYNSVGPGGMDLIIQYRIHPDPKWQRQELNLFTEHTISIWDLITGCETEIRDLLGNVLSLTIPPNTQPGTTLRLKARGLTNKQGAAGDLLVKVQGRIPNTIDPELLNLIRQNSTK